jgi:hypothetical protein
MVSSWNTNSTSHSVLSPLLLALALLRRQAQ